MGEFRWRMGIIFQAMHEIVMSGVDTVFPRRRRVRMLEEMGLYPRRGQRNTALLALMKKIEAEIAARQTTPVQGMELVGYGELE